MSHGSASAHSHRYSLHLFLKMETSTGVSCLCTHHALWRLGQGLNAWLCALSRGLPRSELSFCLSWVMSANGPGCVKTLLALVICAIRFPPILKGNGLSW